MKKIETNLENIINDIAAFYDEKYGYLLHLMELK